MSATENGGPAFPAQEQIDYPSSSVMQHYLGMTVRDYFAAKAMQAAATNPTGANGFTFEERAEWAYLQADAMLAARSKA